MHVLIIDDEAAVRQILASAVTRAGYSADTAENAREGAAKLVRGDVDVALCDIRMPDGDGVELVRSFRGSGIDTQFIMVTAFASVETAVEALRAGATDYIIKPVRQEELAHRLAQMDALRGLKAENRALRRLVNGEGDRGRFQFSSEKMAVVERLAAKVAVTDSTVLVTGESGTGKGVIARAIHEQSRRADFPFIPVNCGAIPENLLESEFFGHTKGAFSGADRARKGLFAQADRGTLFLDEIGELPLHMQTKLLHVIEDKEVRPIGGEQARKVDTRIVAATNRDLGEMVKQGRFREDLYFRLSQFLIHIPPLRERREDIPRLIRYVMQNIASNNQRTLELDPVAEEIMVDYAWPGNVRELENVVNRAYILADGGCITVADLPPDIARSIPAAQSVTVLAPGSGHLRDQLRRVEADIIFRMLDECAGDRRGAAQKLGIGLSSLYRKLEEFAFAGISQQR
ncbi:MAG: sigma-54-dependent Fis family transcriptional regulator [Rhodocyclaceae bacterium]|nr:sigma-54-dependent Fis family transcriptional regulator [Rhodocyclaceae bacterium]